MPYWRLSGLYFFYFAVVGALSPYWGLYLESLGYQPSEIGLLSAIPMLTKLAAPNIWGVLADVSGKRLSIIRLGAGGACLLFVGIFFRQDYTWLIVVTAAYSFFWNAILAQFEVVTLAYLHVDPHYYSRVRVWGSVGFIVTVVVLGYLLEVIHIRYLPLMIFLFLSGIFFTALSLPADNSSKSTAQPSASFLHIVKQPQVLCFLLTMTLLQLSHGVYYTFYSIYLEDHGYSRTVIGLLWAVGVIAEILIFLKMPLLFRRFSLASLLRMSIFLTVLRWYSIGWFADMLWVLGFVQLLHAFSFGVSHAVAIDYIRQTFEGRAQGQGQALYSAVCFGGGNAIGAYVSGLIWQQKPLWAFGFAVLVAIVSFLFSLFWGGGQSDYGRRSI